MAGSSTAVVVISNSKLGPFGDHIWKTRHAMVLVENWITYGFLPSIGFSSGEVMDQTPLKLSVEFTVAQELLFLIAGFVFRDSNFKQLLVNSGLAEMRGIGGIQLIDEMSTTFIKNFQNIVKSALEIVRNQTRLGIVLLETESVLQDKDIEWLRSQGVDVEVFTAEK